MQKKYKGVKNQMRRYNKHTPPNNYLKYWRVIRYWATDKYGLSFTDLDMLFFLYAEGLFQKKDFREFNEVFSWEKGKFDRLMKEGWIIRWRTAQKGETALYEISFKGKRAVSAVYSKLNGDHISEHTPMFKSDSYMDKVQRNYIKKINLETRQARRHETE